MKSDRRLALEINWHERAYEIAWRLLPHRWLRSWSAYIGGLITEEIERDPIERALLRERIAAADRGEAHARP